MKNGICETCKKEVKIEYISKNQCRNCYHSIRTKNRLKDIKSDPTKYKEHRRKSKIYDYKRRGWDLDRKPKKGLAGTGTITSSGYKRLTIRNHPNASKSGWVMEHTYVMCEYLKRPLSKNERVHHKNGNRLDNRIENLELWHIGQPPGQRVEDKIKWCKDFLKQYDQLDHEK